MIDHKPPIITLPPGFPKKLPELTSQCPVCVVAGAIKSPRGPIVDTTELPVGTRLHLDFSFYDQTSICKNKAALTIVEATARYQWRFPCKNKRPPIVLVICFVRTLRVQGYNVSQIRVDEGGELARSTCFMKSCKKVLNIVVETTGGYNSTNNGKVKASHRPAKRTVRMMLMTAGLPDSFWDYALQYGCFVYNNTIHSQTKQVPAIHFNPKAKVVPTSAIVIFGSKVRIVRKSAELKALQARTGGDPRNPCNFVSVPNSPKQPVSHDGYFVGYGNHTRVMLVWSPESKRVFRVAHGIVDEFGSSMKAEKLSPAEYLLRHHPFLTNPNNSEISKILQESTLAYTTCPIDYSKCKEITIRLPSSSVIDLGVIFEDDEAHGLPMLADLTPESPLLPFIKIGFIKRKHHIIKIGEYEPITAMDAIECLTSLQKRRPVETTILLCPVDPKSSLSQYEVTRGYHDSMTHRVAHMVQSPTKPPIGRSVFECLDMPEYRKEWMMAVDKQYNKNQKQGMYSAPIPTQDLPEGITILSSLLSPTIKQRGVDLWELCLRHCANGSKQKKGIDFDFSYSPTASAGSVKSTIAVAAMKNLILALLDVENCFQTTLVPKDRRIVMHAPPFWLDWYRRTFPECKIKESVDGKYYVQAFNGLQGQKDIGRVWYTFMHKMLIIFGFRRFPQDHALYHLERDNEMLIMDTSTDDFLCAYSSDAIFADLQKHISQYVNVTAQTGPVLNYLNLRIIQSPHGISIDQTDHIRTTILDAWFKGPSDQIKTAPNPYRTDSQFEADLAESLPASDEELAQLEYEYQGSFARLIGQINHVAVWTRPDIAFACARMSRYIAAPSRITFEALKRIGRFLYANPHRPIMYKRKLNLTGTHIISNPDNNKQHNITNGFAIFVDADHAGDRRTRKSMVFWVVVLGGVTVDHAAKQAGPIALHSTDAETLGFATATKRAMFYYDLSTFLKLPIAGRPVILYEDSQPCIDVVSSNAISSRVKHIAVPIAFANEKITFKIIQPEYINTTLQPADGGTKPQSSPTLERAFNYLIGVRNYPPPDSQHAQDLELDTFKSYHDKTYPPANPS